MHLSRTDIWYRLRAFVDRLGFRLAVVLAIGLLPLMIVSVVRSQAVINEALARSQAALVGEALLAIREESLLIESAQAIALALSHAIPIVGTDTEACDAVMQSTLEETPFSFVGFIDLSGTVTCSSFGETYNVSMAEPLEKEIDVEEPLFRVDLDTAAADASLLFATHPVYSASGELIGFTRVSVSHSEIRKLDDTEDSSAEFLTTKADGTILTSSSNRNFADDLLPTMLPGETISSLPLSFRRTALDGSPRLYSVVPIVEDELYALATWPEENEYASFYFENPALFPALMWLASLGVAWFATSFFVTRDVVQLRRAMRAFADRRKTTNLEAFDSAPGELRDVAASFVGMTDTILREEAEIENALRQKDVLLREVHHRVKNNLQLITSIMAMQIQQSQSPEVTGLMRNLHDRVKSIATVHQNLYQTSGQVDVNIDELLETIVRQVVKMGSTASSGITLRTDIAEIQMNPDQAVPLALFVTEALTNALKYINLDDDAPYLTVSLEQIERDKVLLRIENSISDDGSPISANRSTGLGTELMEAFAEQLEGVLTVSDDESCYVLSVTFPLEDLRAKALE